jgi:hypothetical protein
MTKLRGRRTLGLGIMATALSLGLLPGAVGAVHEGDYPAHVHTGSCENLGDVVFPLNNVRVGGLMMDMMAGGTPEAGMDMEMEMGEEMGASTRIPIATSMTTVDAPLADILNGEHAINVHLSDEAIEEYVACGDIGGMVMTGPGMEGGGTLVLGLRTLNDSGISGVAVLEGMGAQTDVTLYLGENLTPSEEAAPATPAA